LVDDQVRNLVALEAALASAEYSLTTAQSGTDALGRVLEQDFAVIVLDVHMPGMDGFETAGLIRARERSQSTPIIFLTADNRVGPRVLEGYRLGAVDYLYKPFNSDILRAKVSVFVDLCRKTVALEQRTTQLIVATQQLDRARAAADLRHQALHDGLTGLPNRVLSFSMQSTPWPWVARYRHGCRDERLGAGRRRQAALAQRALPARHGLGGSDRSERSARPRS
jgi:PleD family two-component response regulator